MLSHLRILTNFIGARQPATQKLSQTPLTLAPVKIGGTSSPNPGLYPPNDGRLIIVRARDVMAHHQTEVAAIVQALGLAPDSVGRMVVQPIEQFAKLVLNLPSTRDNFYRGSGGLFRLGLDTALYATRIAQQTEFSGLGMIERRRRQAHRWRLATLLAGLCVDLHRVVTSYVVIGPDKQEWAPLLGPLDSWVGRNGFTEIELAWKGDGEGGREHRAWNLSLLHQIMPTDLQQYLHDGDTDILRQFHAYLSDDPSAGHGNIVRDIVEGIRMKLIARDMAMDPMRFGKKAMGTTLGPYVADGLRQLITSGKWTPNDDKGRVWVATDACYLVWPIAAKEIIAWLQAEKLIGTPGDPHTLAELLRDAGIIKPYGRGMDAASLLWPVRLPKGREVSALRLTSADVLWPKGDIPEAENILVLGSAAVPLVSGSTTPPAGVTPAKTSASIREPASSSNATIEAATQIAVEPPNSVAIERALAQLVRPAEHGMRELMKRMKRPSEAAKIMSLRPDNRIEVTAAFLGSYGFDPEVIARHLASGGWIEPQEGKHFFPSEHDASKSICTITAHISNLLIPLEARGGLFERNGG